MTLSAIGSSFMWAHFVNQIGDESKKHIFGEAIARVALHQVVQVGIAFHFASQLGLVNFYSPLTVGVSLVPIAWAVLYKCDGLSVATFRAGIQAFQRASVCTSIVLAALFVLNGEVIFGLTLGSVLILGLLKRMELLSPFITDISGGVEFLIANIASVLIGAWYHKLRAILDIGLRVRDYRLPHSNEQAAIFKGEPLRNLTITDLEGIESKFIPTDAHLYYPSVALPKNMPGELSLKEYTTLGNAVFCADYRGQLIDGMQAGDDYHRSDEDPIEMMNGKLASWLERVQQSRSENTEKWEEIRRYAFCVLELLSKEEPAKQAYHLARITWNISKGVDGCWEGYIQALRDAYGNLSEPRCDLVQQKISASLQSVRKHLLQVFIVRSVGCLHPWIYDVKELHLYNAFLRVLKQRGISLGLPEEADAQADTYYSGGATELLIWGATKKFTEWFKAKYTAQEMVSAIKLSEYEQTFKGTVQDWIRQHHHRDVQEAFAMEDVNESQIYEQAAIRIEDFQDEERRLTERFYYVLLALEGFIGGLKKMREPDIIDHNLINLGVTR